MSHGKSLLQTSSNHNLQFDYNNNVFLTLSCSIEDTITKFTKKYFYITTLLNEMHSDFLSQMKKLTEKVSLYLNPPNIKMTSYNNKPTLKTQNNQNNIKKPIKYVPSFTPSSSHPNLNTQPKEPTQSVSGSHVSNRKKIPSYVNNFSKYSMLSKKLSKTQTEDIPINTNPNVQVQPKQALKQTFNSYLQTVSNKNNQNYKSSNIIGTRNNVQVVHNALLCRSNHKVTSIIGNKMKLQSHSNSSVNTLRKSPNNSGLHSQSNKQLGHNVVSIYKSNSIKNSFHTFITNNQYQPINTYSCSKISRFDDMNSDEVDDTNSSKYKNRNIISALKILISSKILPYHSKLIIKYLNKELYQYKSITDLIKETKNDIKSTLDDIQLKYHDELLVSNTTYPSAFSQIIPYLLTDENELVIINNNESLHSNNYSDSNISYIILKIIYTLLDYSNEYDENKSCSELYNNLFSLCNVSKINQLITFIIFPKVYTNKSISYEDYIELKNIFINESNRNILDDVVKDTTHCLSWFALVCIEMFNYLYNEYEFKPGVGVYYEELVSLYNKLTYIDK